MLATYWSIWLCSMRCCNSISSAWSSASVCRSLGACQPPTLWTTLFDSKRYRAGKLISTAMAESVVNQVVNARMCKRQQMRWSPRGETGAFA